MIIHFQKAYKDGTLREKSRGTYSSGWLSPSDSHEPNRTSILRICHSPMYSTSFAFFSFAAVYCTHDAVENCLASGRDCTYPDTAPNKITLNKAWHSLLRRIQWLSGGIANAFIVHLDSRQSHPNDCSVSSQWTRPTPVHFNVAITLYQYERVG